MPYYAVAKGREIGIYTTLDKSDRFTNYVTEHGRTIDINYNIQPNNKRQRLLCKECYEFQKMEYETIKLMREKELQKNI